MLFCIFLNLKHCVDFISTASRASMLRDMRSARLKLFCRESSQQDNLQFWTSSNAEYCVRENEVLFADVATTCCLFAAFHKYLSASEYFYNIFIFCSSANKLFETEVCVVHCIDCHKRHIFHLVRAWVHNMSSSGSFDAEDILMILMIMVRMVMTDNNDDNNGNDDDDDDDCHVAQYELDSDR